MIALGEPIDAAEQAINFAAKRVDDDAALAGICFAARRRDRAAMPMCCTGQALCVDLYQPAHRIMGYRVEPIFNSHA